MVESAKNYIEKESIQVNTLKRYMEKIRGNKMRKQRLNLVKILTTLVREISNKAVNTNK